MLKRQRQEKIGVSLTLEGQGDKIKFDITFNNLRSSEIEAMAKNEELDIMDIALAMIAEWDAEYPLTKEGLKELEDDRPGSVKGLIEGFHEARKVQRVKN